MLGDDIGYIICCCATRQRHIRAHTDGGAPRCASRNADTIDIDDMVFCCEAAMMMTRLDDDYY